MPVDGGIASQHALRADNTRFNHFAGLHDRQQRDHAAQRKVDMVDRATLLVEHGVRPKLHHRQPRLDATELVSRKLAQDAVLYDVLCSSLAPFGGAETTAWAERRTE
jgi:hypothetical protein